jgi:glucose/arabinose dehydrogenase
MRILRVVIGAGVLCGASFAVLNAFQSTPAAQPAKPRGATQRARPPAVRKTPEKAPTYTAEEEMKTFSRPPGYHVQLVAKEPLVQDPIAMDFDADGRLWVLEMPGFMRDTSGRDSHEPINKVLVLEDTNGDGAMDKRTVFTDGLVLPRSLKVLDKGVLVGEPPNLWLMTDTNGDLKSDTKELVGLRAAPHDGAAESGGPR